MDPLSALSVAAAVVQFADFGIRLLNDSVEIYRSATGQTVEHVKLSKVSEDLSELSKNIETGLKPFTQTKRPLRPTEQILVRLSQQCQTISSDLTDALNRVRVKKTSKAKTVTGKQDHGSNTAERQGLSGAVAGHKVQDPEAINTKTETIVAALMMCRSKSEIDKLQSDLSGVMQQMMMACLTVLWEESVSGANQMALMSQQQATIIDTLDRIDRVARNPGPDGSNAAHLEAGDQVEASSDVDTPEAVTIEKIWKTNLTSTTPIPAIIKNNLTVNNTWAFDDTHRDEFSTVSIINSLLFEGCNYRETAIPDAYKRTFDWIFAKPGEDAKWADFDGWLRKPQEKVYWVTGKPGAGKSTLMKYVMHHETTKERLKEWSQPLPLIIASFYFWIAGSPMQKSQEGLLRTLLHQFLCEIPHLVPRVCPKRWALFKLFGRKALGVSPEWTMDELLNTFLVLSRRCGTEFNLCLFIDGLDEFDGDPGKLVDLVNLFQRQSGSKVCVSSRPWNTFSDAFEDNPSLRLQDLTRVDMENYANGHFAESRAFLDLQKASPGEAASFKKEVVQKSEGIFLWLTLVVTTLMQDLRNGEIVGLEDLQRVLKELPDDLSALYQAIWGRLNPQHRVQSSQIFQILEACQDPLDVITLYLAEKQGPLDLNIKEFTTDYRAYITGFMRRRVSHRTRGLLEISSDGNVDYLHRTVRDWIRKHPRWEQICEKAPPPFDPNLSLLVATAISNVPFAKYHFEKGEANMGDARPLVDEGRRCLSYASKVTQHEDNIPLLVKCLDLVDKALGSSLGDYCHMILQRHAGQKYHHPFLEHSQSMVHLAAEYGVASYVSAKVTEGGYTLRGNDPDTIALLGCAVLGSTDEPNLPARYELVRFLLDRGAMGSPKVSLRKAEPIDSGWRVYQEIKRRQTQAPLPFTALGGEQCADYWEEVQALVEGCQYFREWREVQGKGPRRFLYKGLMRKK